MESRNPAPWTTTLDALTASRTVQTYWRAEITQGTATIVPDVIAVQVDLDARFSPAHRANLTLKGNNLTALLTADALTTSPARLDIWADYQAAPSASHRIMSGRVTELAETGPDTWTLTAESFDATHDYTYFWNSAFAPDPGKHLSQIVADLTATGQIPRPIVITDDPSAPLMTGTPPPELETCWLYPGDKVSDWLRTLLDCYPDAARLTPTDTESTFTARTTKLETTPLDLRPGSGLRLDRHGIRHHLDNWGRWVRFTAEWVADGAEQTSVIVWGPDLFTADPLAPEHVVDVRRRMRPAQSTWEPLLNGYDLSNYRPMLDALLGRIGKRTWTAVGTAKPCLWVRPGMTAQVADDLTGIVTAVRFSDAAMTYTVEPI